MLLIEPSATVAVRLAAAKLDSSARLRSSSATFSIYGCSRLRDYSSARRVKRGNCIRAVARKHSSSGSGPLKRNGEPQKYHPLEEIAAAELSEAGDASLTPAETTRTIIEVNNTAMMAFSCFAFDEIDANLFWPDADYVTDEYGNIYFRMKNEADIPQSLSSGENAVQVVIGEDPVEMSSENEFLGHSEMDFGIDELDDEDSDFLDEEDNDSDDDDYVDWVDDEDEDSGGSLWDCNLDTMQSSHPMDFAKRLAEVVFDNPAKYMEQPSAKLVIQGFLRPALIEEHSVVKKKFNDADCKSIAKEKIQDATIQINGGNPEKELMQGRPNLAEELEKEEMLGSGTVYYKLQMFNILLVPYNGSPIFVEIVDYMKAQPDALVHSAATIISHVEAGGENTMQALKSLCWRCKGIRVEEAALLGIDGLGFDVRICSGTQVQTLRFAFKKRAFSEYSAERQLNDLLFPRSAQISTKERISTD